MNFLNIPTSTESTAVTVSNNGLKAAKSLNTVVSKAFTMSFGEILRNIFINDKKVDYVADIDGEKFPFTNVTRLQALLMLIGEYTKSKNKVLNLDFLKVLFQIDYTVGKHRDVLQDFLKFFFTHNDYLKMINSKTDSGNIRRLSERQIENLICKICVTSWNDVKKLIDTTNGTKETAEHRKLRLSKDASLKGESKISNGNLLWFKDNFTYAQRWASLVERIEKLPKLDETVFNGVKTTLGIDTVILDDDNKDDSIGATDLINDSKKSKKSKKSEAIEV